MILELSLQEIKSHSVLNLWRALQKRLHNVVNSDSAKSKSVPERVAARSGFLH